MDVRGWGAVVIGLDNFNDYYDVQLKKVRALSHVLDRPANQIVGF